MNRPNIYFAPMEGITAYPYRNTHREMYQGVDKYYMPFIGTQSFGKLRGKFLQDVLPEWNDTACCIPQLLSNSAEDFVTYTRILTDLGYREINLNAGCPSGTVVAKQKGAGMLADPDALDAFLDGVFCRLSRDLSEGLQITVKTRIGLEEADVSNYEYQDKLIEIYNRYPISELTVHPRYRRQMYQGHADPAAFARYYERANMPICYNGDVFSVADYAGILEKFPKLSSVMIGRGLLTNPELAEQISAYEDEKQAGGNEISGTSSIDLKRFQTFHDRLYRNWKERMGDSGNELFRMKELWSFLGENVPEKKKALKKIRKAKSEAEYLDAVREVFS